MSDSNKPKSLPPDDFGATTPNIKIPKDALPDLNQSSGNDWEKTNYNYSPKDLGREDWNKTQFNIQKAKPAPSKNDDWDKIALPSSSFDDNDFGERDADAGKTRVGINLPRNEPAKYQEPPSEKQDEAVETRQKGGLPGWIWASAGLLGMFLFSVAVLALVYFVFLGRTGFEVVVKNPPARSEASVDGSRWGVTGSDGTIRLQPLRANEPKKIEILSPGWSCQPIEITVGEALEGKVVEKPASCAPAGGQPPAQQPSGQCVPRADDLGESARKCAYAELDKLEKAGTWSVEDLLRAMNLYIINFDKNSSVIKPADLQFIERAAGFMKKLPPNTVVEVGGHTDSDSSDDYNMKLSDKRATSVRNALVEKGITSTMLRTKAYGETQPKYPNTTNDGKFGNRRIEYKAVS